MYLRWTRGKGGVMRARSRAGSKIIIREIEPAVFLQEVTLLGREARKGLAKAKNVILGSPSPRMARAEIVDALKRESEGYVLRHETTGVADPEEARLLIIQMGASEWARRLGRWQRENSELRN